MFDVGFTSKARADLRYLKKAAQSAVLDAIEKHLANEPLKETRNRKPLRPNDLSEWELRVGIHRVFYDVDVVAGSVTIKAIGWKEHNKLFIGGKEYDL